MSPHIETGRVPEAALAPGCQEALQELAAQGRSKHTPRSYGAALRYWQLWYELVFQRTWELPVDEPVVLTFIAHHAQRLHQGLLVHALPPDVDAALVAAGVKAAPGPLALNTVLHRLWVLSAAHRQQQLANPCHAPRVRQARLDMRKAAARRGEAPHRKDAALAAHIGAMVRTCDVHTLRGLRDAALLWFGWSTGGRRRSEISAARREQLRETCLGEYEYELVFSKSADAGSPRPENLKPVVEDAAQAMQAWLDAAGIEQGFLFRSITGHSGVGEHLSEKAVNAIVHKRSRLAGLRGDWSAHSLRSGMVTQSVHAQVGTAEAMGLTGHAASSGTFHTYVRADRAAIRRAAVMLVKQAAASR